MTIKAACRSNLLPIAFPAFPDGFSGSFSHGLGGLGTRYKCSGLQNISFAESFDLVHWQRPAPYNATWFDIDTRYYDNPGRWDCIYSIPAVNNIGTAAATQPVRYGFWTASPGKGSPPGSVFGFGQTMDGYRWEALPSPRVEWGHVQPFGAELGAVERIDGAYYAMVGHGGNMMAFRADAPQGPYTPALRNFNVLPGGSCYFARFFRTVTDSLSGDLLVTHQSFARETPGTFVAPYKLAVVDPDGALRLHWWPGNDALRGSQLPTWSTDVTAAANGARHDSRGTREKGIHSAATGGNTTGPVPASAASASGPTDSAMFDQVYNTSHGVILEADVSMPPSSAAAPAWPGFLVEMEAAGGLCTAVLVGPDGNVTVGEMQAGGTGFTSKKFVSRDTEFAAGSMLRLRVLVRRSMIEAYVNGILWQVYTSRLVISGRLGATIGPLLTNVTVWQMNLPGEASPPLPPPPPPPLPPTTGDLCLHRPTTCSSVYKQMPTYGCGMATDGDYHTRWSSGLPYNGSAQWVAVDLGALVTVGRAFLVWETAFARGFSLQVGAATSQVQWGGQHAAAPGAVRASMRDDRQNMTWTTFHTVANGTGGAENVSGFEPVQGRYFRILCTERFSGSPYGFSLFEFELFAP